MNSKERLEVNKMSALLQLGVDIGKYRKDCYDERILKAIYTKKKKLIEEANTCAELKDIMSGPKPFDDSGISVPEEEMIMWSKASLVAPLNHLATERYIALVKNVYGKDVFA